MSDRFSAATKSIVQIELKARANERQRQKVKIQYEKRKKCFLTKRVLSIKNRLELKTKISDRFGCDEINRTD